MTSVRPVRRTAVRAPANSLRILFERTIGRARLDFTLKPFRLTAEAGADATMHITGSGAHDRLPQLHAKRDKLLMEFLRRMPFAQVRNLYR